MSRCDRSVQNLTSLHDVHGGHSVANKVNESSVADKRFANQAKETGGKEGGGQQMGDITMGMETKSHVLCSPRNYTKAFWKRGLEQNNDAHNGESLLEDAVGESVTKCEKKSEN